MKQVSEIECVSRIDRVVVHARGALITRVVTWPATLPSQPVDLVVSGVTPLAIAGSARVSVDGTRNAVGVRTRQVRPSGERIRGDVTERLARIDREIRRLELERDAVVSQSNHMTGLVVQTELAKPTRRREPARRIADALAATEMLRDQRAVLDERLRALDRELHTQRRLRESVVLEQRQATPDEIEAVSSRESVDLIIRLEPSEASIRALHVSYAVDAARWFPAYTARLTERGTNVRWSIDALIVQATGESWNDVAIECSTADLAHDATLPELSSLRLGRARPRGSQGFRPPPPGLEDLFAGFDRAQALIASEDHEPAFVETVNPLSLDEGEIDRGSRDEKRREADVPYVERARRTKRSDERMALLHAPLPSPPPLQSMPAPSAAPTMAEPLLFGAAPAVMRRSAVPQGGAATSAGIPDFQRDPSDDRLDDAWFDFDSLTIAVVYESRRGQLVRRRGDDGAEPRRREAVAQIESVQAPRFAVDPMQSRGHFDYAYVGTHRATVAADAQLHRLTLATADGTSTMEFRSVPRVTLDVFREAVIRNPFDRPLLSGPVDVVFDSALLSTSSIDFVDRGGDIRLGLGVEDRVRIARNARVDESSAGLLGGQTAVDHAVQIDLHSSLDHAIAVCVIERVPVTDDKEIDVTVLSSRPAPQTYDQADRRVPLRGGLRFDVAVPASGKAHVEFSYRIKLSAKSEVVGGNRREQ